MNAVLARTAPLLCILILPAGHSARAVPRIAVGVSEAVWTMRADGSDRHRLTPQNVAYGPELSPNGALVAYDMRGCKPAPAPGSRGPAPLPNLLSVLPVGKSGRRWSVCGHGYSWSPNGRLLASFNGETLIVRSADGRNPRVLLQPDHFYGYVQTVWSPDSRQMAVPLYGPGSGLVEDRTLRLAIVPLQGSVRRITIRFPSGSLGANNWTNPNQPPGSFPTYSHLSWTRDGHHLLAETMGNGRSMYLTGIWEVSASGGTARLTAGTPAGIRERARPGPALDHATAFTISPNGKWLATNPQGRLWVGDLTGHHGRLLTSSTCPPEQVRWLADSSGLVYIASCTHGATSILATIGLARPVPRVLIKSTPGDMDLNSPFL